MRHRHVGSVNVGDGFDVFERFKFRFYVVISFAELFEQHLAQIFRGRAWFAGCGDAFDGKRNAAAAFLIVHNVSFQTRELRIWRYAPGELFKQRRPEETAVDVIIENASGVDDVGQLGGTLLRLR